MLVLSPSAEAGPLVVSGAPKPVTTNSKLVNKVSVKPRLGQWSKVLVGGPNLQTDETNAIAVLYPVPNGGQAHAFVIQDQGGANTIDLSPIYIYPPISRAPPLVEPID